MMQTMQTPPRRYNRSRRLRRQQPTHAFGVANLARDWSQLSPLVHPAAPKAAEEQEDPAVVAPVESGHQVLRRCASVRDLKIFKVQVGPDPYAVLEAVGDKFEKQLTANGIIYTLHHGILPPAWGYAPRDDDPETIRHTAESIVSYRRSASRLTEMIAAIRSRGRLERSDSFYDTFATTVAHVAATADRKDGSDALLGQLSVIAELLPADVTRSSPPDFGVSAHRFNAFAGRLEAFLDGLSTVMSAAPFTTRYNDLNSADNPESEEEVDALRDAWSAVFPQQPRPTVDIPVSMSATEHVVDGVHMLVCVHAAAVDADTGEIRIADVLDSIDTLYPDRVREFLASAVGVGVDDLGSAPYSFCYFSTRRPDGKHHLSTSAFHRHALTPTRDEMAALFPHAAVLAEPGRLANRFTSAIISDSHRPQFARVHAVSPAPFAVFVLNNAMRGSHGPPLPADGAESFARVMVRVDGCFAAPGFS